MSAALCTAAGREGAGAVSVLAAGRATARLQGGKEIPRIWKFAGMQLLPGRGWLMEVVSTGLSERFWIRNSP